MLAVVLSYIIFIMLRYVPYSLSLSRTFMLNFVKGFFCIYWDNHVIVVSKYIYIIYYIYGLSYVETVPHSWDKANYL